MATPGTVAVDLILAVLLFLAQVGLPVLDIQERFWFGVFVWISFLAVGSHLIWILCGSLLRASPIWKVSAILVFAALLNVLVSPGLKRRYEREHRIPQAAVAVQRAVASHSAPHREAVRPSAQPDTGAEHHRPSNATKEKVMAKLPPKVTVRGPVQGPLVISQNQSGGQTAATINNFGPPKRTLAAQTRAAMIAILRGTPSAVVGFASTQGDIEASEFKALLMEVFKEAGWSVVDAATFMFFGEHKGLIVTVAPDVTVIENNPAAMAIANALGQIERPVKVNRGVRPDGCEFWIQVWHAP